MSHLFNIAQFDLVVDRFVVNYKVECSYQTSHVSQG